jgi:exosortase
MFKESGMSVPAPKHIWRALPIFAAVCFAYATVLVKLSRDWWTDENYSHGLLVPFIIGYILWSQRDKLASTSRRPSFLWGGAAVAIALFALWAGVAGAELYMQRMSLILLLAGTVVYLWGAPLLRFLLVPLTLLVLAIPIPAIIFNQIAFPLQLFASRCAVWSMSLLGFPVLLQGNVIELKPLNSYGIKKLEVVEACSGIRSLMTLITLAVVFAYFSYPRDNDQQPRSFTHWLKSYGFWRSVIIVGSAVPIAILTNALRVSGTGVLAHIYGIEIADGFFHEFSGWVIYIAAFLMLFGVAWIVDRFKPTPASRPVDENVDTRTAQIIPVEGAE